MHTASAGINTLVANCVTLTPGTITVDVHVPEPGTTAMPTLYIHALHFVDVESARCDVTGSSAMRWPRPVIERCVQDSPRPHMPRPFMPKP